MQILKADEAFRSGQFDSWIRGVTSAARVKGCAAAIVPNRLVRDMIQVSLNKAHEIVANDRANRLAKIEGEGEDAVAARAAITYYIRTSRPNHVGAPCTTMGSGSFDSDVDAQY